MIYRRGKKQVHRMVLNKQPNAPLNLIVLSSRLAGLEQVFESREDCVEFLKNCLEFQDDLSEFVSRVLGCGSGTLGSGGRVLGGHGGDATTLGTGGHLRECYSQVPKWRWSQSFLIGFHHLQNKRSCGDIAALYTCEMRYKKTSNVRSDTTN